MKKLLLTILLFATCAEKGLLAQTPQTVTQTAYVQITTIESVVGGGIGRSKMIITKEDGNQEERDIENLFSMAGINFRNIKQNETTIIQTLKSYTDNGWKLFSITPFTLSPGTNGMGIFMTRYLLTKDQPKK
jgi:hypothetical protein